MRNRPEVVLRWSYLGAPFYTHVELTPTRRCYLNAAVGGFCPKLHVYWRYDLNSQLSELLRAQIVIKVEHTITIDLPECCGMVRTAYIKQVVLQDRPKTPGYPVLLRGDNVAAVS